MTAHRITFPRAVLLVEIVRRCAAPGCGARTRVGLTKDEARAYTGFECERCEARNDDVLAERDVPEWWEELTLTGLDALRPPTPSAPGEPSEVIRRLSDAWHRERGDDALGGADEREN